nr:hypothetical protein pC5.7b_315 [Rhizobium rhizogenes]
MRRLMAEADAIISGSPSAGVALTNNLDYLMLTTLVQSKIAVARISRPVNLGVVFAMWRESKRLRERSHDNPSGEDCLRFKVEALEWLFSSSSVKWKLYAVDDGCPEGSAGIASEIVRRNGWESKIVISELVSGFPYRSLPLEFLASADDSIKGGAIILGAQTAISEGCNFVAYTDCDNSVHLGQIGAFLAKSIVDGDKAVFGDRTLDPGYGLWWHPGRTDFDPRNAMLLHLKRLMEQNLCPARDVPSPLKLFEACYLTEVIDQIRTFDFSFDYDIACCVFSSGVRASALRCLAVDSVENSAWQFIGNGSVWLQKMRGIANAILTYRKDNKRALAELLWRTIEEQSDIAKIQEAPLPEAMRQLPFSSLGDPRVLSEKDLEIWLGLVVGT